ncbi:MAG: efflux transporter outer membrane subunit [Candidatus Binatia bacterium]
MPPPQPARRARGPLRPGALVLLALAGCTLGPDYRPPEPAMPAGWEEASSGVVQQPADLSRWWTLLGDPTLDQLEREAVAGNLTLREAVARVDESRARADIALAAAFPQVDALGSTTYNRNSENGPLFGGNGANGIDVTYDNLSVGVAASWEADIFGRVRRSVESATALEEASQDALRNVLVVLCADVAQSYVTLRTIQQRLAVAHANLASQEEIFRLTRARFELGLSSGLDVAQATQVLATTRTLIPPLELARTVELNRLALLLGEQPGALRAPGGAGADPRPPDSIAVGLPVNLLRQRPDIRRAERDLAARRRDRGRGRRSLPALHPARHLRLQLDRPRHLGRRAEPRLQRRPADDLERLRRRPPARPGARRGGAHRAGAGALRAAAAGRPAGRRERRSPPTPRRAQSAAPSPTPSRRPTRRSTCRCCSTRTAPSTSRTCSTRSAPCWRTRSAWPSPTATSCAA